MSQKLARRTIARLVRRGYPRETITLTAKQYKLPKKETRAVVRRTRDKMAHAASRLDVLAEFRALMTRRGHQMEELAGYLRAEPKAPASAHSTFRAYLKDQQDALVAFDALRAKHDRNRCRPPEERERRRKARKARDERVWAHMGLLRDKGYYYLPGIGAAQPESCLDLDAIALRDAVRLRHLPKSPYEDRILAEQYGATFPEEKHVDPESLSKQPLANDEFPRDPVGPRTAPPPATGTACRTNSSPA